MKKKNLFLARRLTGRYASLWVSVIAILLTVVTASVLLLLPVVLKPRSTLQRRVRSST